MIDQAYPEMNNQPINKFYSINEKSMFKEVLDKYKAY